MQQSHAKLGGVLENVRVQETLEDAILITTGMLPRHQVELVRDYRTDVTLLADKHKLLQIAVNLLQNAGQACQESGRPDARVIVRIQQPNNRGVQLEVIDNGVGIAAENLTKLFSQGFTTRTHGHGFGLHSCVLAAEEMNGSLNASSDGVGKGARFLLELPTP